MIINIQKLAVFCPFFILMFSLVSVVLSISYNRNHFFVSLLSIFSLIFAFFSLFFLVLHVPIDIVNLFHINGFSILYIGMIIISSISTCIFAYPYLKKISYNKEEFYLLMLISTLGAILSIISNHMCSLFINIELMSLPIFGLIAYFNDKKYTLEASFKYIILSSVASSFLLLGVAWIYSVSGSLSFSCINKIIHFSSVNEKLVFLFGGIMIMISLFFKLSIFPFHLWSPDVYQGTSSVVLSFFSTAGKIAIFAVLLNFLSHFLNLNHDIFYLILTLVTMFSMIVGNLMALYQNDLKRFFGYSSISQLGYLFIIFFSLNKNYLFSLEASSVYLFSYICSNIAFFGIMSLLSHSYKEKNTNLTSLYKGLFWSDPVLASMLSIVFLSLAGFPMTLGFLGKFYILSIIIKENLWIIGISFLFSTIVGFYCYLRIIVNLYSNSLRISDSKNMNTLDNDSYFFSRIVISILVTIIIIFGIYPIPLINLVQFLLSF